MNTFRLPRTLRICGGFLAALFALVLSGAAHPDLIDQITQLTTERKAQGESAALYEQRADLYRRHAQFDAALMDIAAAERLATNSPALLLAKARIFSDAGQAKPAFASKPRPILTFSTRLRLAYPVK